MNKLLLIFSGFFTLLACDETSTDGCPEKDENQGIIIQSFFDQEDPPCFLKLFSPNAFSEGFVISSQQVYDSVMLLIGLDETACTKPDLDFNEVTLLSQKTKASGCTRTYLRSVTNAEDGYLYRVVVRECGGCEPLITQWHWVTIPKIEPRSKVFFETKTQHFDL